jgi:hypothetical protein
MDASMSGVNIRVAPASAGFAWLRAGMRILWRQPVPLLMLAMLLLLLMNGLVRAPPIFLAFVPLLFPAVLLGTLSLCRWADAGGGAGIARQFAEFRAGATRLRLLQVGVCYALVTGLAGALLTLVPDESPGSATGEPVSTTRSPAPAAAPPADAPPPMAEAAKDGAAKDGASGTQPAAPHAQDEAQDDSPSIRDLVKLLVMAPVAYTFLFATVLVGWHGLPTPKALFFGVFAVWRNRTAILMNLSGLLGIALVIFLVLAALLTLLGTGDESARVLLLTVPPLLLVPISAGAEFAMVRDIIEAGGESLRSAPPASPPPAAIP